MKIISTIIPFVMFFALKSCLINSPDLKHDLIDENLTYIDMAQAKFENRNAEEIFKDFEIIPLETHSQGLLKIEFATYYLTDKERNPRLSSSPNGPNGA